MSGVFDFFEEYDIIRLEGKFVEKFFNIATRKKIKIWNVRYIGKSVAMFNCYRKDYEKITEIAEKISAKVYIMDSKGVMHEVNKYKKRVSLYIGAAVMAVVLTILSNVLCIVSVTGNTRIPDEIIINQLEEAGLSKGRFVKSIDIKSVKKKMLARNDEITWIGITIKGAKAEVEIVEKVLKPYIIPKNEPANIVAVKDGVVESIIVKDGFQAANKGDTVKKGQLLVSSVNESNQGDIMLVHSQADIKLKTWNYLKKTYSLEVSERIPLNEFKNYYSIEAFGKRFNLFFGEFPEEDSFNITETKKNILGTGAVLVKSQCEKIEIKPEKYSPEEVLNLHKKEMYDELINTLDANCEIVNTEYNYITDGENVIIDLCIVAVENGGSLVEANIE